MTDKNLAHPSTRDTGTVTLEHDEIAEPAVTPVVRLRLKKPRPNKKVAWTSDTVDNEHLNKKKSKCCCIYEKPHEFDESSSESDDECEHCRGHVEKKKDNKPVPKPIESPKPVEPPPLSQGL